MDPSEKAFGKSRVDDRSCGLVFSSPKPNFALFLDLAHKLSELQMHSQAQMEQARFISLDEWPLVDRAIRRFGNAKNAIEHLRRLGGPPGANSTRPAPIEGVLEVVGALAANMTGFNGPRASQLTAFYIKRDWRNSVEPWVKYLLRDLYLNGGVPGPVPQGINVTDHILTFVPLMLSFTGSHNDEDPDTDVAIINRASPDLHALLVQVWCTVLDLRHSTWGDWSILITDFAPAALNEFREPPPYDGPYVTNESVAPVLLRHLHALAADIHDMPFDELRKIKSFLGSIPHAFFGGISLPMHGTEIQPEVINAFGTLATRVMSKRRCLAEATVDSSECRMSHLIATISIQLIETAITDPSRVVSIMDTGLLKAIFRGYPCLFAIGETGKVEQRMSLQFWIGHILDRVGRFSIFSSVLHRFARIHKSVESEFEDPGEVLKEKSMALYEAWTGVAQKAKVLRDLRLLVKRTCDPRHLCSNETCPLKIGDAVGRRFLRCSGCNATMYCTVQCRKEDWKSRHRERCLDLQQSARRRNAPPIVSVYEYNMVSKLMETYFLRYAPDIMRLVDAFIESLSNTSDLSDDQRQIVDKTKTPILFCDFDRPDLAAPEYCIQVYDTENISCMTSRASQQISYVIGRWRAKVDAERILIWAEFPRMKTVTLPVYQIFQFPLRSDPNQRSEVDLSD